MEVWIFPPTYVPPGTNPNVNVTWWGVDLWTHSWKNTRVVPPMQSTIFTVDELPMKVWAEATQSASLRDLSIRVDYNIPGIFGQVTSDQVRATGIWSEVTAVAHDVSKVAGTGVGELWEPGTTFADTEGPPRTAVDYYGGAGLRPLPNSDATGTRNYVANVILIQFTVTPSRNIVTDGRWEADGVFFDPTRQVHARYWIKLLPTDPWTPDPTGAKDFPTQLDRPNDDESNNDESQQVTANNHVYVVDAPGIDNGGTNSPTGRFAEAGRFNFYEFMRVGIGGRPAGETEYAGSRASPFFDWHAAYTIDAALGTRWQRTTGDNPESHAVNSVGPIHITIGNEP
jgi:hypothetical protein